jgi:methionyl-tRNA synthetase
MLKSSGFSLPSRVHVHGFLTINGVKMSKSRGTYVLASSFAEHLDPEQLRYYFASKLGSGVDDIDLDFRDFVAKVNADLVGKVVNLASRTARFVEATGLSEAYPDDGGLFAKAAAAGDEIAEAYDACDYARAMRTVMALADRANEYVDRTEPWKLAKDPARAAGLRAVSTVVLNLYRQIVIYLAPVLPSLAAKSAVLLGAPLSSWSEVATPAVGTKIGQFSHLMQRVDAKKVDVLLAANAPAPDVEPSLAATAASNATEDDGGALQAEPLAPECTIDDFAKVDLRVARVIGAEQLPEAQKLIKLTLSLGGGTTRTVFAGIKSAYAPADLVGRLVVVVANLAPRKMKLGTSEGMVIAAGPGDKEIFLLSPDSGAKPGQRVH